MSQVYSGDFLKYARKGAEPALGLQSGDFKPVDYHDAYVKAEQQYMEVFLKVCKDKGGNVDVSVQESYRMRWPMIPNEIQANLTPPAPNEDPAAISHDEDGQGQSRLDKPFFIHPRELRFPGAFEEIDEREAEQARHLQFFEDPALSRLHTIRGKWVYVFEGTTLVNTVFTESESEDGPVKWVGYDADDQPAFESRDGIVAKPKTEYTLFISPVRLEPGELESFVADGLEQYGVKLLADVPGKIAALIDPFQWAADVHDYYYLPRVEAIQEHLLAPENQAGLLVASTIYAWGKSGDESVQDTGAVPGAEQFCKEFREATDALRASANEAASYLAGVVDSGFFKICERSCIAGDQDAADLVLAVYAIITDRLNECQYGRQLAYRLAHDEARVPVAYIFGAAEPPANAPTNGGGGKAGKDPSYSDVRRSIHCVRKVAVEFIKYRRDVVDAALKALPQEISELGIDLIITKPRNLGDPVWEQLNQRLHLEAQEKLADAKARVPLTEAKLEKANRLVVKAEAISVSAAFVLDFFYFIFAVEKVLESRKARDGLTAFGATMGLTKAITDAVTKLDAYDDTLFALSDRAKEVLGKVGTVTGLVSSACTAIGYGIDGWSAQSRHDYDAAGANYLAMTAGIASFAQSAGWIALAGPAGLMFAIGLALVSVGFAFLAAMLADGPREAFAKHCFLGPHGNRPFRGTPSNVMRSTDSFDVKWSPHPLPPPTILAEAEVAEILSSHYMIELTRRDTYWYLTIHPGALGYDARFEVVCHRYPIHVAHRNELSGWSNVYIPYSDGKATFQGDYLTEEGFDPEDASCLTWTKPEGGLPRTELRIGKSGWDYEVFVRLHISRDKDLRVPFNGQYVALKTEGDEDAYKADCSDRFWKDPTTTTR